MAIIEKGIFTIPLYHGTTGLFIESIKQYGLGCIDPLIKLEAKEFMHDLFDVAEKQHWNDDNWLRMREHIQPIVFQQNIENVLNFKHGESYLTYSSQLAGKYAIDNPLGCEYLTYLRSLLGILTSRKIKGLKERFLDRPTLKVWEKPHDPYLIILNNVKIEDIETEAGENLTAHIEEIEKLLEEGIYGPQSFKLKKPINENELIVKKLGNWNLETGDLIENQEVFSQFINRQSVTV